MKYYLPLILILLSILIASCSELEEGIQQPEPLTIHPRGFADPGSPEFHGIAIKKSNWDIKQCRQCHGGDFHGGIVDQSCTNCHSGFAGPENCSTCHGDEHSPAPPSDLDGNISSGSRGVGAHRVHLARTLIGKSVSCADCHRVPSHVYEEGHIDSSAGAEVIMNGYIANLITNDPSVADPLIYDEVLPVFSPDPSYNPADLSCSGSYCHGSFKNGNTGNAPVWNDPSTAQCGTCHGDITRPTPRERALPKTQAEGGTHPGGTDCHRCHGGVVDENLKFVDIKKHIDGKLNVFGRDVNF